MTLRRRVVLVLLSPFGFGKDNKRNHRRILVIDGRVGFTIGSTNLDNRSFALNEELNVVVYDKEVANRLEGVFAADLAHSRKIHPRRWRARGLVDRLLELLSLPIRDQI